MINMLNFPKANSLIPVIIQEEKTGDVLMLGYMNKEALEEAKKTGLVHFWSRARKKIWKKGETSGNFLKAKRIFIDCDGDTLLVKVELIGKVVCHTGNKSCFYKSFNL